MASPDPSAPAPLDLDAEFHRDAATTAFAQAYGGASPDFFVRAPGRVNLIGEHTDYNDGFVCPLAIRPHIAFACRRRDDSLLRVYSAGVSPDEAGPVTIDLAAPIGPGDPAWANYVRGPAALLREPLQTEGKRLRGLDVAIVNSLPKGGGLSSSAAMEIGTALALLHAAHATLPPERLIEIGVRTEHEFAGARTGIMDQTIVAGARAGHAMLLDCRDRSRRWVPLDPARVALVVVNSMDEHRLVDGEYARRREQCEAAVRYLRKRDESVAALRDVTPERLDAAEGDFLHADGKPDDVAFRRARHVVTENARTLAFENAMRAGDYAAAGELMVDSHISLADDYEVTTPRLDFLAHEATQLDGCYGARMTGGGFGGCVIALVRPDAASGVLGRLRDRFLDRYDVRPDGFVTPAADAAGIIAS